MPQVRREQPPGHACDTETAEKVHKGTVPLSTADIAEAAYWVASLPPHVNINFLEIMPTCQGYGPLTIKRKAL